jgi:hypothetical protein
MNIVCSQSNGKVSFELCAYEVPASDDKSLTNEDFGVAVAENKGISRAASNRDIVRRTDFHVVAEGLDNDSSSKSLESGYSVSAKGLGRMEDDELPLQATTLAMRKISNPGPHRDCSSKEKVHF